MSRATSADALRRGSTREPPASLARPEPWIATVLRTSMHALAAAVWCFPLTTRDGVIAAAIGSALGALGGRLLARTRLRLVALVALAALGLVVVGAAHQVVVGTGLFASWLGPAGTLGFGECVMFGLGAFVVSAGLRALSGRRRTLAALEVAFVALAFAELVAAHRDGAINRPFEIADPILSRGGDPTIAILAVGAAATAVIVLSLLDERSVLRTLLHLGILAALLLGVLSTTRRLGLPPPPPTGAGLGLRGEEQNANEHQGRGSGGGRGRRNNDELEFRDNYQSSANRVPVAVVLLHDDYSPPTGIYYFRQGVFSQYNGRRLVAATRSDVDRDIAPGFPTARIRIAAAPPVTFDRTELDTTVALLADHSRPFALESPVELEPSPNPDPSRFRRTYRVQSSALAADYGGLLGRGVGDAHWTREQWAHYTKAPPDARYGALAHRIEASLPEALRDDPVAKALAVTQWLGHEGTYSLRSHHASAGDPTASFLFGDKIGYCVHFAHAATYLMRSLGLPARVATGYAIDESARAGGSALLVTGDSSHAWPEVYVTGVGWVVADVSPERVLDPPPPPPDPDLQRLLGELARGEAPLPLDGRGPPPAILAAVSRAGATLGLGLLALLGALLVALYLVKAWRWLAPLVASERALPRVAYRAQLDRLAEVRHRRAPGETQEAFAARLGGRVPSFVELTWLHVGARFGSKRVPTRDAVRAAARRARGELARTTPLWRRALGWIEPWSWWIAR